MIDSCILFVGLILFTSTVTYDLHSQVSSAEQQKNHVEELSKK